MNRSDFLKRLLQYYAAAGYKHWIYIGDSSNAFHMQETKKAIEDIKSALNIRYFEYSGHSNAECMKKMIDEVTTPYAVFIGDDDYLIPTGLDKCIEFLQENKDYSGANGKGFSFILKEPGAYGEFVSTRPYGQKELACNTATQRLVKCANPAFYFVTLFSVHRIEVWKEMYKHTFSIPDTSFAGEIAPCFIGAIEGNIKHIDTLYLGRQIHNKRKSGPDYYDWIVSPQWNSSYQILFNSLVDGIVRKDNISKEAAGSIVKQAFWRYISILLSAKFQQRYGKPQFKTKNRIKEIIKSIGPAASILRKVKGLISPMSLPALLNSRSLYHRDFIQVYNSVAQEKK